MQRQQYLSQTPPSKFLKLIAVSFLFAMFFVVPALADTVLEDIQIDLGIEIGNIDYDFADQDTNIEKKRFVSYKIELRNNGDVQHKDLVVLMDTPDYMEYVQNSTEMISDSMPQGTFVADTNEKSPLELGYQIPNIEVGETFIITAWFQASVSDDITDDSLDTMAWANVWGKYSAMPIVSNFVNNTISGEAISTIAVKPIISPLAGTSVNSAYQIMYAYEIRNVGGMPATGIMFTTFTPEHTLCVEGCGIFTIGGLGPNETMYVVMKVVVSSDLNGVSEISNVGYDIVGDNFETIQNRTPIIHIIDSSVGAQEGEFSVNIGQVPNIILNSPNGSPRADQADRTETQYSLSYQGRNQSYTWPTLSSNQSTTIHHFKCADYTYPQQHGAYTYAYNSNGGGCDNIYLCPISSSSISFDVDTVLPESTPKLEFTINETNYQYGDQTAVHSYMKNGGIINVPSTFTESRAVENGAVGIISTAVSATVSEDQYQYNQVDTTLWCTYTTCGETSCTNHDVYRPVYKWQKVSSTPITLEDTDSTDITVYTSTAWLKTEGGHIGTNDNITNIAGEYGTTINKTDLSYDTSSSFLTSNSYVKEGHETSSSLYTPPLTDDMPYGGRNADYMIFGKNGTGTMKTSCGGDGANCDDWKVSGTEFPFVQRGEVYDRTNNARDYYEDLLVQEKYGEVKTDELPSLLTGIIELGDDIIWNNTNDITIGQNGADDSVMFSGGQVRIYTDGDVYINANIIYDISSSTNYNDITSVRIDANNIYVSGEVTDISVMLLARNEFHSGVSKKQLRILGDVIAGSSYWEREPLMEYSPKDINSPSEYIIEDMRKYIVPAPGDTEIPDNYTIWTQVNPSTGEVLDAY